MLNDLDSLSHNIGRLLDASERSRVRVQQLEQQLAEASAERDAKAQALSEAEQAADTLRAERDVLAAKIDEAQDKLRAILERLPYAPQPEAGAAAHAEGQAPAASDDTAQPDAEPSSDEYAHDR